MTDVIYLIYRKFVIGIKIIYTIPTSRAVSATFKIQRVAGTAAFYENGVAAQNPV